MTDIKQGNLLESGTLAIVGGAMATAIFPPFAVFGYLMIYCGAMGIGYYWLTWSKFDRLWRNLGLCKGGAYPLFKGVKQKSDSKVYTFRLPAGMNIEDFDNNKLSIEQYVGKAVEIRYTYKAVQIEVLEPSPDLITYEIVQCKGAVAFPVGYTREHKLIECNLASDAPHMLIAGETGSGKSTILRAIITNLILTKDIKLHLIDLKNGAEFQIFRRCEKVETFCRTKAEASELLHRLEYEIDRRYNIFFKNDVVDIKEYNKRIGKMGYEVLIVDEFADLQREKQSIYILEEMAAKARACGIHIILSTQRPDANILNGRIKANITTVLGLKTTNEINSRIIIDGTGLEKLKGKGQGIFKRGEQTIVQCPYLSAEIAREMVSKTYVDKHDKKDNLNGSISDFDFLSDLSNDK